MQNQRFTERFSQKVTASAIKLANIRTLAHFGTKTITERHSLTFEPRQKLIFLDKARNLLSIHLVRLTLI